MPDMLALANRITLTLRSRSRGGNWIRTRAVGQLPPRGEERGRNVRLQKHRHSLTYPFKKHF